MAMRVERLSGRTLVPVLLLGGVVAPARAPAQEPIVPLQLSFSDPGARSMGFGGAFVALADDATAAFANPAGLVQLARPEVSIEGRRWGYSTPFTRAGRVEGFPSGAGIDTRSGLTAARSDEAVSGLSFLSVAYPRGRWSLAFFRHQLADFEFDAETQGLFGGGSRCCQVRWYDQRVSTRMSVASYGVSGGYRLGEKLSLGFGLVYHDVSLGSRATLFLPDDTSTGEALLGPTSFFPDRAIVEQRLFSDATDWALTGGFLWRLSRSFTLGGVYRQGPRIEAGVERTAREAGDFGVPPGTVLVRIAGVPLDLPWVVGLGVAYRAPGDRLTLSFQWDRVDYSSLVESLEADDLAIDDAHELHLGAEYVFLDSTPIVAVRLGAWWDPDHQVRATGDDPLLRALQPPGDDQVHFTFGLGVALRGFQIDVGVDLADQLDTVSVSAIYSF